MIEDSEILDVEDFILEGPRRKPRIVFQHDRMDCGPACLAMIAAYYGRKISLREYRELTLIGRDGTSLLNLKNAGDATGLQSVGIRSNDKDLNELSLLGPFIALMDYHFVVVFRITNEEVLFGDPALGLRRQRYEEFRETWTGYSLLFKPTQAFYVYPESAYSLEKYWNVFWEHRKLFAGALWASALSFLLGLSQPLLLQALLDRILHPQNSPYAFLIGGFFVALTLLMAVMGWTSDYFLSHLSSKMDGKVGALLFRQILRLPLSFLSERKVGDFMSRFGEIESARDIVTGGALSALLNIFSVMAFSVIVATYSLAAFAALIVFLILICGYLFLRQSSLRFMLREIFALDTNARGTLYEHLNAPETLHLLNAKTSSRLKWEFAQQRSLELRYRFEVRSAEIQAHAELLGVLARFAVLWISASSYFRGELTMGQMVALNLFVSQILSPALSLVEDFPLYSSLINSLEKIDDVFGSRTERIDGGAQMGASNSFAGSIEWRNVSFRFGNETSPLVLKDINLTLNPGEIAGIAGKSGSGKSTLVTLINALNVPTEGSVLLDQVEVRDFPLGLIRSQVGYVMQDNSLFSGSILENIGIRDPRPSLERAMEAAKEADAHDFISNLPLGYHTNLGVGGEGLSGGQKQRINLARALYSNPKILILDEATSGLDSFTENRVMMNLIKSRDRRTTILISHRHSTLKYANRFFLLQKGEIREVPSHAELKHP